MVESGTSRLILRRRTLNGFFLRIVRVDPLAKVKLPDGTVLFGRIRLTVLFFLRIVQTLDVGQSLPSESAEVRFRRQTRPSHPL